MTSRLSNNGLSLLTTAPSFRALFLATLGSGLGTGIAVIALTVDVYDRTGSGTWVAALLIADFLPMLAIGLLLGPVVDRFSRRRVMVASDLTRLAVYCALPFAGSPAVVVALAGVAGLATGFFRPAVYAGMPNLVAERDLPQANGLFQTIENLTFLVGPLLGGLLLALSGADLAYWLNAVTFAVSAALIVKIPDRLLQSAPAGTQGHWRDLAEGFDVVRRSRALMTVLVTWTVVMLANGGVNVAEVALAKAVFGAGNLGLGLLMASAGLGLVLGSITAGGWLGRRTVAEVYGGAIALMALGITATALSPNVWVGALFVVVSGYGNGVAGVCNPLLVQRGAPDRLRGRAFTVVMSVNFAMLGVGMAVAGPLTDGFGARWVWGGAGAVFLVAAGIAYALARTLESDTEPDASGEVEPERLLISSAAAPAVTAAGATPGGQTPLHEPDRSGTRV